MAKKAELEAKPSVWIYHENINDAIMKVVRALLNHRVRFREMPIECLEWITKQCEDNGYDKLIGYDLSKFVDIKWNQYKKKKVKSN